jgi:dTDP-4-dehydrorhamnose 3,5-epimerase
MLGFALICRYLPEQVQQEGAAMRFTEASLKGVWLTEPIVAPDERGFFARTFCVREYAEHGLETTFVQHSVSYSRARGTLRGLHFQQEPHAEVKIVTCLKGAIWDVVVDLRRNSPTYCRWEGFELTADTGRRLYIPKGFAHGFQSLCDDVEVGYLISEFYTPGAATGVRYDDPVFGVAWPLPPAAMSAKDRSWPDFRPMP